jgi:hypothetical protein
VVAAGFLVGAAVGDVQGLLVGRERQAVGLVEGVGNDREAARRRVVPVDEVAPHWLGPEALQVAVAGVGEPDGAVALDHHVVGRVERQRTPGVHHRLQLAGGLVQPTDPGRLRSGALLADDQASLPVQGHPVGRPRHGPDDRDLRRAEGKPLPVQRQALDRHLGEARRRHVGRTRQSGEVQRVLAGDVHGSLVGVGLHHPLQPGGWSQDGRELRVVLLEGTLGAGVQLPDRACMAHVSMLRGLEERWDVAVMAADG